MSPERVKELLDNGVLQARAEGKVIQSEDASGTRIDFGPNDCVGFASWPKWRVKPEPIKAWVVIFSDGSKTYSNNLERAEDIVKLAEPGARLVELVGIKTLNQK